jgi:hypothetical protein
MSMRADQLVTGRWARSHTHWPACLPLSADGCVLCPWRAQCLLACQLLRFNRASALSACLPTCLPACLLMHLSPHFCADLSVGAKTAEAGVCEAYLLALHGALLTCGERLSPDTISKVGPAAAAQLAAGCWAAPLQHRHAPPQPAPGTSHLTPISAPAIMPHLLFLACCARRCAPHPCCCRWARRCSL